MEATEPKLEHLFDVHVDLEAPQVVGPTPQGMRQIFIVKGGTVEGPRIKGKALPGGGDWALIRSDGAIQLDIRATVQTDDGALIYLTYGGLDRRRTGGLRASAPGGGRAAERVLLLHEPDVPDRRAAIRVAEQTHRGWPR